MPAAVLLPLFTILLSAALIFLPLQKGMQKGWITFAASILMLGASWRVFFDAPVWQVVFPAHYPTILQNFSPLLVFSTEGISGKLIFFLVFMLPILAIGAIIQERKTPSENHFYTWFLLGAGLCFTILATAHLYILLFMWGIAGIPLFMLASGNTEGLAATGKKTLILFGSTHGLMATGAVMTAALSGATSLETIELNTSNTINKLAFLALASGGLMAMGIIPLHGWIIRFARYAPGRAIALMPVIIHRITGTYLLIRLCNDLFILSYSMKVAFILLGAITAILGLAMGVATKPPAAKLSYIHIAVGGLALIGITSGVTPGIIVVFTGISAATVAAMLLFFQQRLSADTKVFPKQASAASTHKAASDAPFDLPRVEATLPVKPRITGRKIVDIFNKLETSGYTDIYPLASKLVFSIHRPLSRLHDGVLQTYLVWVMAALVILFLLNGILYGH